MYRDKTRRKRQIARTATDLTSTRRGSPQAISETELEAAASGVL